MQSNGGTDLHADGTRVAEHLHRLPLAVRAGGAQLRQADILSDQATPNAAADRCANGGELAERAIRRLLDDRASHHR